MTMTKDHRVNLIVKLTTVLEDSFPSCINCINFQESTETCVLVNARPPARVLARGCESWEEDIPF